MTDAPARVRRVVAAGRRIADAGDPLGAKARAALLGSTGLSAEGVELALSRHLETDPSDEDLASLLASAGRAGRCHVVLSANVCTAALRAIAIGSATAPALSVRPSRRDPVVAELLAGALAEDAAFAAAEGSIALVTDIAAGTGDELHVYGSDATIAIYRERAPDALVRGHGTGLGIAIVGVGEDLAGAARMLADDVVPFDQRGCLSPRFALVEGDAASATAFARHLGAALERCERAVPRGRLDEASARELALYGEAMSAVGSFLSGKGFAVGIDPAPKALLLPPAARVVHVVPASLASAEGLLLPWARLVTSIGVQGEPGIGAIAEALAPLARRSPLGAMQRPPLDGPVDRRGNGS